MRSSRPAATFVTGCLLHFQLPALFVAEPGAPAFMVWSARSDTLCPHMYSEKHLRQASGRNGIRGLSVPQRLYTKGACWKLKLTSLHAHGDVVGQH